MLGLWGGLWGGLWVVLLMLMLVVRLGKGGGLLLVLVLLLWGCWRELGWVEGEELVVVHHVVVVGEVVVAAKACPGIAGLMPSGLLLVGSPGR